MVSYYTLEEMYSVMKTPVGAINTAVAGTTMAKYMGVCDFSAQGGELYNSLIAPLSKIPVTGHFWYQGESDQSNANFVDYLEALIGTWRANWNNENMPFIYTQLPRSAATFPSWWGDVDENGNPTSTTTYNFSDAHMWQLSLYQKMKNNGVYMSVAIDTTTKIENQKSVENPDYEDPLHPRNKAPIGKRMADIALNAVYGKTEIKHLSPVPVEFELSGNEITITFEGVYDGLETTDGNAPKHFEIVNQAGVYVQPDSIEIVEGNKIVLSSDSITEPKGVAYFYEEHFVDMSVAFAELVPTLTNSEALPASPFVYTFPVKAPDEGYGELIFLETFEGMEGTVANTSNLPSYMLGTYEGKKVMVYDRGAGSSYKVATPVENGGNMLEISGGNYPQMTLLNLGLNKAGTYVVMFDYYLASNTTISFMQAGFNNSNTRFDDVVKGAVTPVVLTKTISEGETISSIDIQTGFTNPALYIDNIRIYYSESAAPVAIKANSIRTSGDAGIRFISFANKAVRASASEYGHM
ncbi:MAG: hypothetical protein IJZ20_02055, partial [Clostridia bacterium]|nr:hypothetical protein [Clostridia bacterium]